MSTPARGIRLHDTTPPTPISGWADHPGEIIDAETGEVMALASDTDLVVRESRIQGLEAAARDALDRSARGMRDLCLILGEHMDLAGADSPRTSELIDSLGLQRSTGYNMARIGQAARAHPALLDLADRKRSAVLALLQGIDNQGLAEVCAGQSELTLDDVDRMSIRDLKRKLRVLRDDTAKVVAEETKTLRSERDALREDLAAARAALDSDPTAVRKTLRRVREHTEALAATVDQLMDQMMALEPRDAERISDQMAAQITLSSKLLKDTWQRWMDKALDAGLEV